MTRANVTRTAGIRRCVRARLRLSRTPRLDALTAEYAELERTLADPAVHADQAVARRLGRQIRRTQPDRAHRRRPGSRPRQPRGRSGTRRRGRRPSPRRRTSCSTQVDGLESELAELLAPRDPDDGKDVIVEVKAGEGGEESALFAGDLLRMYLRYAERRGWKTEILSAQESDLGGYNGVTVAIKAPGSPAPADGVWARLKYEGGVHRVQRVPVTESQGRIHTSAAGVFIAPGGRGRRRDHRPRRPADRRVPVLRPGRPDRSTPPIPRCGSPTCRPGIVVSCQNEKSQLQNKEQALRILRARLLVAARDAADAAAADARRSQVRTVDRSERIRTYNFAENRIADHRVGYKAYNLDAVLAGDLDAILDALAAADRERRLAGGIRSRAGRHGWLSRGRRCGWRSWRRRTALTAAGVPIAAGRRRGPGRAPARHLREPGSDWSRWSSQDFVDRATSSWSPDAPPGVPLQYLTGSRAARTRSEMQVGPGVFVPRPETEVLLAWALEAIADRGAHPSWSTCSRVPARSRWPSRGTSGRRRCTAWSGPPARWPGPGATRRCTPPRAADADPAAGR